MVTRGRCLIGRVLNGRGHIRKTRKYRGRQPARDEEEPPKRAQDVRVGAAILPKGRGPNGAGPGGVVKVAKPRKNRMAPPTCPGWDGVARGAGQKGRGWFEGAWSGERSSGKGSDSTTILRGPGWTRGAGHEGRGLIRAVSEWTWPGWAWSG